MSYERELGVASQIARDAGDRLRAHFERGTTDSTIKDGDAREPVTSADLEADRLISTGIRQSFPNDLILTEETAASPPEAAGSPAGCRRWVVDPLDGTSNFIAGVPFWAVSIALEDDGECVLGVVYDPIRDELFQSARGQRSTCNGDEIRVSAGSLSTAVVAVLLNSERRAQPEVRRFCAAVRATREFGATALELAWVAAGRLDFCLFRRGDRPWDWLAGARLITDAGGELTAFGASIPQATLAGAPPFVHQAIALSAASTCATGSPNAATHERHDCSQVQRVAGP